MRSSILLALFALVLPALSLRHGDVGINIAVRTDENGELVHFYEKDEIEHFEKLARREAQPQEARPDLIDVDPQSDRYPVKMDADGKVVPFTGAAGA